VCLPQGGDQPVSLPALEPFKVTLLTQPHAIGPSVERLRAIIGEEVAAALPGPALRLKRSSSKPNRLSSQ
jgi:hypothetical protein